MKEIEYKFLVKDVLAFSKLTPTSSEDILQGYLVPPTNTAAIRVRISKFPPNVDDPVGTVYGEAFITVKGPAKGLTRDEWEVPIPVEDAEEMMKLCNGNIIQKTRYFFPLGEHTIEVDVFDGDLAGLVMAEIEVKSEDEKVEFPDWFGKDVSTDHRFTNIAMAYNGLPPDSF